MKKAETTKITAIALNQINSAIKAALAFEKETGKQLNITSIVGEVLACKEKKLLLVKDDINAGFDAIDKQGKKVQIKTRRYKGIRSAQTGSLLNKDGKVPFDYALLVLLDVDYTLLSISKLSSNSIKTHFDRINKKRKNEGKLARKTMSISQSRFTNLYTCRATFN